MYVCMYVYIYVCVYVCMKKVIFYLTMHATHFIYGYMVKDHADNEQSNHVPILHGL